MDGWGWRGLTKGRNHELDKASWHQWRVLRDFVGFISRSG